MMSFLGLSVVVLTRIETVHLMNILKVGRICNSVIRPTYIFICVTLVRLALA